MDETPSVEARLDASGLSTPAPTAAEAPHRIEPVARAERVTELDAVRGFALLGILLMNIEWFGRPMEAMMFGLDRTLAGLDFAAGWAIMAFVQGKFYTLFSLLFGMGFAIQAERALAKGVSFGPLFARRMGGLALIGAAHGFLLWSGDILLVYSIVGFVMVLLFRKTPVSRLPKWALAFVILVLCAQWAWVAGQQAALADPEKADQARAEQAEQIADFEGRIEASRIGYGEGTWTDQLPLRAQEMGLQLSFTPIFGFLLLSIFLLGAWLVRSGRMARPAEHLPFFRKALAVGLLVGVPGAVAAMRLGAANGMTTIDWPMAVGMTVMTIANFALAFAYLSGVVLFAQTEAGRRVLRPVSAAGRMALTNYLLQSVIGTTLFYGWGFGLYGQVPRAAQVPLTFAIWGVNIALSVSGTSGSDPRSGSGAR